MNILKIFKSKPDLTTDEEKFIEEEEKQAYFKEAVKLAKERGIRKARRKYDN